MKDKLVPYPILITILGAYGVLCECNIAVPAALKSRMVTANQRIKLRLFGKTF